MLILQIKGTETLIDSEMPSFSLPTKTLLYAELFAFPFMLVYFPKKNILGSEYAKEHIEYISLFPKFKDSWIQYYVSVADLGYYLPHCFCYEEMELEEIKYTVQGIVEKTETAMKQAKFIPKQFMSRNMKELVELVKKIEMSSEKPEQEEYWKVLRYCNEVKLSMENLALQFDVNHLRFLFESEGVADF